MSDIPSALREEIIRRSGNRCEYFGLSQAGQEATFHVDHVVPRAAGGPTEADNLALACVSCSLRKSAKQFAPDPETGLTTPLFIPGAQKRADHFGWDKSIIIPLSPTGRATVAALERASKTWVEENRSAIVKAIVSQ